MTGSECSFDAKSLPTNTVLREARQALGGASALPWRGAADRRQHRQAAGAAAQSL